MVWLWPVEPASLELGEPGDVDEDLGRGEAELHHGEQRLAAGDELGLIPGGVRLVERSRASSRERARA